MRAELCACGRYLGLEDELDVATGIEVDVADGSLDEHGALLMQV